MSTPCVWIERTSSTNEIVWARITYFENKCKILGFIVDVTRDHTTGNFTCPRCHTFNTSFGPTLKRHSLMCIQSIRRCAAVISNAKSPVCGWICGRQLSEGSLSCDIHQSPSLTFTRKDGEWINSDAAYIRGLERRP